MLRLDNLHQKLPVPYRYVLAAIIFTIALSARVWLFPPDFIFPYLPFYVAVALSFYLCGTGPGMLVMLLGAVAANYFIAPFFGAWDFNRESIRLLLAFVLFSCMVGVILSQLRKYSELSRIVTTAFEIGGSIMITDANKVILRVNRAFTETTGYTADEAVGRTPRLLQSGRHNKDFYRAMWETIHRTGTWQGEIWDKRKNGEVYPKWLTISAIKDEAGVVTHYVGAHTDLSDRVQMLAALQQNERHLKYAQLIGHIGSWDYNFATGKVVWTDELYRIYGVSPETFTPSIESLFSVIHPDDRPAMKEWIEACTAGRKPVALEFRCVWPDGSIRYIRGQGELFADAEGKPVHVSGTGQDITERIKSERRLQDLSAHLQTVREEEKASIAREIHDDLGGTLTALKMDIYWLADELTQIKEAKPLLEHIESMSQLLDNAVAVTRRVITDLRPTILDDLGLQAALEWQAEQFHKRTGIRCEVGCIGNDGSRDRLDKMQTINLFRIFQESLTNVARHSGASGVDIELRHEDEEIILTINDNGRGLSEDYTIPRTSYGMLSMRERAAQMGGRIDYSNLPGGGFSVKVTLPRIMVIPREKVS